MYEILKHYENEPTFPSSFLVQPRICFETDLQK